MTNEKLLNLKNIIKQIENSGVWDIQKAKSEYNSEVMRANKRLTVNGNLTRARNKIFDDMLESIEVSDENFIIKKDTIWTEWGINTKS